MVSAHKTIKHNTDEKWENQIRSKMFQSNVLAVLCWEADQLQAHPQQSRHQLPAFCFALSQQKWWDWSLLRFAIVREKLLLLSCTALLSLGTSPVATQRPQQNITDVVLLCTLLSWLSPSPLFFSSSYFSRVQKETTHCIAALECPRNHQGYFIWTKSFERWPICSAEIKSFLSYNFFYYYWWLMINNQWIIIHSELTMLVKIATQWVMLLDRPVSHLYKPWGLPGACSNRTGHCCPPSKPGRIQAQCSWITSPARTTIQPTGIPLAKWPRCMIYL